ncbi:MAG: HNH endonuclease signature motif containing protein [Candidatus Aminicenantales bacterium]
MKDIEYIQDNIADYVSNYVQHVLKDLPFYQKDEGYKFQAVATFQKGFSLKSKNWLPMIERALKDASNLVQSGQYFPKGMLLHYIQKDETFVRKEFEKFLVGKENIVRRIDDFIYNFQKKFPPSGRYKQSYFDYRFLSFFLASYKPDEYFYVKSSDYKRFSKQIGCDLDTSGREPGEKYQEFAELAEITREVLKGDEEFKKVHQKIVSKFDFKDPDLNWGTYDFIFNVSRERWKEKVVIGEKRAKKISDFREYYRDTTDDEDKIEGQISGKSTQELLEEGKSFKPHSAAYIEKAGNYKVRLESTKQKRIIKELNEYSCQICGFTFAYKDAKGRDRKYAQVDHIIDKSDNGTEELSNLWVLCPNCHAQKTLGVIIVDKNKKQVSRNGEKVKFKPGHLKEFGWNE